MARIKANIAALEILKGCEGEEREATAEERRALAAYSGWGFAKTLFDDVMAHNFAQLAEREARMPGRGWVDYQRDNEAWRTWQKKYGPHHGALRKLLTETEYAAARRSILDAHYTGATVGRALWAAAIQAGFKGGRVLEPTCGSGFLLATMPAELRGKCSVVARELDHVSARIAALLHPDMEIEQGDFLEFAQREAQGSFDLIIGNVPFGGESPGEIAGEPRYNTHNFFIRRSLDLLRPGGVMVTLTSCSTMEANPSQRVSIGYRAELIGAIRFPNNAFLAAAGTEVVEDLLVLRRPDEGAMQSMGEAWQETQEVTLLPEHAGKEGEETASVNEYFVRHPDQVLGHHALTGAMYGAVGKQYTVEAKPGADFAAELAAAVSRLPANVMREVDQSEAALARLDAHVAAIRATSERVRALDEGSYLATVGEVFPFRVGVLRDGQVCPPSWRDFEGAARPQAGLPRGITAAKADEAAIAFAGLAELVQRQVALDIDPQHSDSMCLGARVELRTAYHKFVKEMGRVTGNLKAQRLFETDPRWALVSTLEEAKIEKLPDGTERSTVVEGLIMRERTYRAIAPPTSCASVTEAVAVSRGWYGRIDVPYIAGLVGRPGDGEAITEEICHLGLGYFDPQSQRLCTREEYLSGPVRARLEAAKAAQAAPGRVRDYAGNISALEGMLVAKPSMRERLERMEGEGPIALGATWIPAAVLERFINSQLHLSNKNMLKFLPAVGRWALERSAHTVEVTTTWAVGNGRFDGYDVVSRAINRTSTRVYDTLPDGSSVFNPQLTEQLGERVRALRQAWREWLLHPEQAADLQQLEELFASANDFAGARYDGKHLVMPGLAAGFTPRPVQRDAIARGLVEKRGMLALGVGYGKTATFAILAERLLGMGQARRICMVCDNASYGQFADTFQRLYPHLPILVTRNASLSKEERARFAAQVASGRYPVVVMSRAQFGKIRMSTESRAAYMEEELREVRAAVKELRFEGKRGGGQREAEKLLRRKERKLEAKLKGMKRNQDDGVFTFERFGFDFLMIDEAHNFYRRAPIPYEGDRIKGLPTGESQRALDGLLKARWIQQRRGEGTGVILGTGTPINNTLAEVWAMLRMCAPLELQRCGVERFKDFLDNFCETTDDLEVDEATMRWSKVTRLAKFKNGPELLALTSSAMEVRMDPVEAGLKLPRLRTGEYMMRTVPMTDAVADVHDRLCAVRDEWDKLEGKLKRELSYIPIVLIQIGLAASIDPRLVDRNAPDDPESLVNHVVRDAIKEYAAQLRAGRQTCQPIFCDRYSPMSTAALNAVNSPRTPARAVEADAPAESAADLLRSESSEDEEAELATSAEEAQSAQALAREAELSRAAAWNFNLHYDIRDKLVAAAKAAGVPLSANQIIIASDHDNTALKGLCVKCRTGEAAFIIGTRARIGTGLNFQDLQVAQHHVGPPLMMVPSELTQSVGRGIRDGNRFNEVAINLWGMEDTAAVGVWGRIRRKEKAILQVLNGAAEGLDFEDPCAQVNYDDLQASLVSDRRQLERAELMHALRAERMRSSSARNRVEEMRHKARSLGWEIERVRGGMPEFERARDTATTWPEISDEECKWHLKLRWSPTPMSFGGNFKTASKALAKVVEEALSVPGSEPKMKMGSLVINGVPLQLVLITRLNGGTSGEWELDASVQSMTWGRIPDGTFTTADGLLRGAARLRQYLTDVMVPAAKAQEETWLAGLSRLNEEIAKAAPLASVDEGDRLAARLRALEEDMRLNPAERRRRKPTVAPSESHEAFARPSAERVVLTPRWTGDSHRMFEVRITLADPDAEEAEMLAN